MNIHFVLPVFYLGISNTVLSLMVAGPQVSLASVRNIPSNQWAWLVLFSGFAVTGLSSIVSRHKCNWRQQIKNVEQTYLIKVVFGEYGIILTCQSQISPHSFDLAFSATALYLIAEFEKMTVQV